MIPKTFRTILVDDEDLALKRLEKKLKPFSDLIEIIGKADNGLDAVKKINSQKPDLIFLDIQMPGLNGFEVLQHIDYLPLVIFSTAFDKYALKAFKTNSIDYLLKPIQSDRLDNAIEKLKRLTTISQSKINENILELLNNRSEKNEFLQVKIGSKYKLIAFRDIVFFKADNKYVELHTASRNYTTDLRLYDLEKILPNKFCRIHKSYIVNKDFVDEITPISKSVYSVKLSDNFKTSLHMSRHFKKSLLS